jgi:beta-glucanase (GH16 family)
VDDGYHRFGCLWEEDGYTFFVDGKQSGRKITDAVSHTETFLLIGTEIVGYRNGGSGMPAELTPLENDFFAVDYVRVFDKR